MDKLTDLDLGGTAIKKVPSSINNLTGLHTLNLSDCRELNILPRSIHMKSLHTLDLSGCSNLKKFPEISKEMDKLTDLDLGGIAIKKVPSSINNPTRLHTLNLNDCRELNILRRRIHMKSLQTLDLSGCSHLEKFLENSEVMKELSQLYLDDSGIKELPSSINNLSRLVILGLSDCRELKSLPSSIRIKTLWSLDLSGCSKLEEFPKLSEVMEDLAELHLGGTVIKELPSSINYLTGLVTLNLKGCRELKILPSCIHMKSL